MVVLRVAGQLQLLKELVGPSLKQLVEHVEVSLAVLLLDNTRLGGEEEGGGREGGKEGGKEGGREREGEGGKEG